MLKTLLTHILVLATAFAPLAASADAIPKTKKKIPDHGCGVELVDRLFNPKNTAQRDKYKLAMEGFNNYFVKKETRGLTNDMFCEWLRAAMENPEADYGCAGDCNPPVTQPPELRRSIPDDVQERLRALEERGGRRRARTVVIEDEKPIRTQSEGSGGSFLSSPLVMGFAGGLFGGLLGGMIMNRMNQPQQRQMFPMPAGGPWNQFGGINGAPAVMPFGGAPAVLPYGANGQFAPYALPYAGQQSPWAIPNNGIQQYPQYGNYNGGYNSALGAYGGAPAVMPLAPQSYSVMGNSIPATHWSLINAGR